jgi:predicted TIM-barrel fold metal-dependent hydrolase
MVIDVHCHVGYSARRIDPGIERFSFEARGGVGTAGFDSYFSPRLLRRSAWYFVKKWLGIDHLYVSNSLVRAMCRARPERYLFGASIHPYRPEATAKLEEVARAGAVLIKWLPIHQNIDILDARTIAFLRKAAELNVPMLIHYGGEMSLSRQHMEFERPEAALGVLRELRREGRMPVTIIAHAATPSFPWQSGAGHRALVDAMLGEFADAPLYADISALAAFGRTAWLRRLARRQETHRKLVWGSDFPIPVMVAPFWTMVPREMRRQIKAMVSWVGQDLALKRALGFDECVFTQAAGILRVL